MLVNIKKYATVLTSVLALTFPLNLSMEAIALAQTNQDRANIVIAQSPESEIPSPYEQAKADLPEDLYVLYRIVDRIVRSNNIDTRYWRVTIVPDYSTQLYASSAYVITLDESLLDLMGGDVSALSFVIAHEMAHHVHNHLDRVAELFITGSEHISEADNQEEAEQRMEKWEERMQALVHTLELEADKTAYQYVARAGLEPEGCVQALNILTELPGASHESQTHPALANRIEAIQTLKVMQPSAELAQKGQIEMALTEPLTYELSEDARSLRIDSQPRPSYGEAIDDLLG